MNEKVNVEASSRNNRKLLIISLRILNKHSLMWYDTDVDEDDEDDKHGKDVDDYFFFIPPLNFRQNLTHLKPTK